MKGKWCFCAMWYFQLLHPEDRSRPKPSDRHPGRVCAGHALVGGAEQTARREADCTHTHAVGPKREVDNETDLQNNSPDAGTEGYFNPFFVFPVQNKSKTVIHNILQLALWATDHL